MTNLTECEGCGADVTGPDADGDHASYCRWWDSRCIRCGRAIEREDREGFCDHCWDDLLSAGL